jgi:hypothetical protein
LRRPSFSRTERATTVFSPRSIRRRRKAVIPTFAPIPSSVPSKLPAFFRSTKLCPISPAFRFRPSQRRPSRRTAPPIPVPTQIATTSRSPFAAPYRASPSAAARTSFSSRFGTREVRLERGGDRPPLHAEVRRAEERRPLGVERSRKAEAERPDVRPPRARLRERRVGRGDERGGHLLRAAAERALHLPPAEDAPALVDRSREDLRSAHVDSEDELPAVGHGALLCG